jgi:hypothetical protein
MREEARTGMASGTKDEEKPGSGQRRFEKATKHPLREAMLAELDGRMVEPAELAAILDQPTPWVEYHCRVLEAVGGLPEGDAL